ncbi:response regulator transcription factor [Spirosoma sp. KCTC 42546]|uniref:LytR/AlgR family response regulator transcription factor n=1 Tax=Spirosoma sp. KCTC 42546 TaxID=2520506 RepID=UPI00115A6964|nr:LytTR family DNA-binding domain-containing protein [Spirosoma sp. KCTC 42546]QDK81421.1 response regulator transcription factor [Spirosoma sp. KCTC 42546]
MNVLIIEDESWTAQRLVTLLREYDPTIRVLAQLPSVAKAINWFKSSPPIQPDLIFLDIFLEDDLGFSLIEQMNLTIPIIFTTAHENHALQAFKANSIDYLLKPIDLDELTMALNKFKLVRQLPAESPPIQQVSDHFIRQWTPPAYRDRFMISIGPKLRSIRTDAIAYFFFENKATYLMPLVGSPMSIDYSLDKLGQLVDPGQFFRVNRSFLVAISAIQSVHTYSGSKLKVELHPIARQDVFVSVERVTEFKDWLGR